MYSVKFVSQTIVFSNENITKINEITKVPTSINKYL